MGYQFIHLETYSRKPDTSGRSADWVLAEARRDPSASLHVKAPQPPELVHGVSLEELQILHDELAGNAKTVLKNGKSRSIRKDQQSILTVVASYPTPTRELTEDPEGRESLIHWEKGTVAWLQSQYGDDLVTVIRHTDERYPHLHAYVVPRSDPELRALRLHPGHAAKRLVMDSEANAESKKELNRIGDRAYRQAMREWQDSYHQHVGIRSGLTRVGPKRRRLTRKAWHAEQVQARALRNAREKANEYVRNTKVRGAAYADKVKARASEVRATAEKQATLAKAAQERAIRQEDQARSILQNAKLEARRILENAERYKGFGKFLRSIWDGLTSSILRKRIRSEFEAETIKLSRKVSEESSARRRAETRAAEIESGARNKELSHAATSREASRLKRLLDAEIGPKTKKLTPQIAVEAPSGCAHGS